ncbi:MAG: hypothetical protein JHD02_00120 [Thermoleophilaceae bacterium]|nr:hypothetical protein [Thermoleophilaceae bacterium]
MSIQIVPPSEKQLEFFHSLAKQLNITDPEVPKSKSAATMKIGEYKFELTTGQLAALSDKMRVAPAEFDAEAITPSIDRKILAHPSMEARGVDRIHHVGVDGDDPDTAVRQDGLRARFEMPFRQKHIDFELARLNLIHQQKLTGEQATLAEADAPYEERYQTMLGELKRIKQLPTRRQLSRIKSFSERYEQGITLPSTRDKASRMVKDIKEGIESGRYVVDPNNAPGAAAADLPDERTGMTLKQEAAMGGADGIAYRPDEYERASSAPWDEEREADKTANMNPEEIKELRERERNEALSDAELDPVRQMVTDEMDPRVVREQLGNLEQRAADAGIPLTNLPLNDEGLIEFKTTKEALDFLDNLREAPHAATLNAPIDTGSETPTAVRGNWGDEDYEIEAPTPRQTEYFNDLIAKTGVRIREATEEALPVEGVRILEDSIAMPETKAEMRQAIDALKNREADDTQLIQTMKNVQGMNGEQIDEIAAALRPQEREVFEQRFRLQGSRAEVADDLDISEATVKQIEKSVSSKVARLTKTNGNGLSAAQMNKVNNAARRNDDPGAGMAAALPV